MAFEFTWWLQHYGYLAVAIGTFFEGESILLAGVVAAKQNILDVRLVAAAAVMGSFAGDQLYFFLGKTFGHRWLVRYPQAGRHSKRVFRLLERHQNAFILAFRFIYGLRTVAPFVMGASGVDAKRFMPLNLLGAILWSVTFAFLGLAIVDVARHVIEALPGVHAKVVAASLALPLCVVLLTLRLARKRYGMLTPSERRLGLLKRPSL